MLLLFFSFIFFTLRTVYAFCIRYKIDIISSKAYKSVVRMTQVFDLEKCSISKTLLQVFKRENGLIFCIRFLCMCYVSIFFPQG